MASKKTKRPAASTLSPRAREIIARTKKARAELDARIKDVPPDNSLPVMVVMERKREQPEESETLAVDPAIREVRARKTAKARAKRIDNMKARREVTQESRKGSPDDPFVGRVVDEMSVP